MNLFNNGLAQIVIICLLTQRCLCCVSIKPCTFKNRAPRSGIIETALECTGVANTSPITPANPAVETCALPSGKSFTVRSDTCPNTGPLIFGTGGTLTETNPTSDVTVSCSNEILTASGGGVSESGFDAIQCRGTVPARSNP